MWNISQGGVVAKRLVPCLLPLQSSSRSFCTFSNNIFYSNFLSLSTNNKNINNKNNKYNFKIREYSTSTPALFDKLIHSAFHGHDNFISSNLDKVGDIKDSVLLAAAARGGQVNTVKLLLSKGNHVDALGVTKLTPLQEALHYGHVDVINVLLENGASITLPHPTGCTPLHNAVTMKNIKLAKLFIEKGIDVNTKDNNGVTAIFGALDYPEMVKLLIDSGADMNVKLFIKLGEETTPIISAIQNNHIKSAQILVEAGADISSISNVVNEITESGYTQLTLALRGKENTAYETVSFLLSHGADPNKTDANNLTPLYLATSNNDPLIIQLLIKNGAEVDFRSSKLTPLQWAFVENCLEAATALIACGANLDVRGGKTNHPLSFFCNSLPAFEMMQQHGVNFDLVDDGGFSPIFVFVEKGYLDLVKKMLDLGVDVNARCSRGTTPIFRSLIHREIFHYLLVRGARLDIQDVAGNTVFHLALMDQRVSAQVVEELISLATASGLSIDTPLAGYPLFALAIQSVEKMRVLYKAGANISSLQHDSGDTITALHHAAENGNAEVIKALVNEMGMRVNELSSQGYTAAYYSNIETLETLIELGLDLNIIGESGESVLHSAVRHEDPIMVEMILKGGANKNVKNARGETPLDYAVQNNLTEIVKLLEDFKR